MNKKSVSVEKYFDQRRSEIVNKFKIDESIKNQVTKTELMFVIKMIESKNDVINSKKTIVKQVKPATLEEKRSEIIGKFIGFGEINVNKVEDKEVEFEEKVEIVNENVSLGSIEEHLKQKRSEIINKFDVKRDINEIVSEKELSSIIKEIEEKNKKVSKRKIIKKDIKIATLEEKRSEIIDKFMSKYNNENVLEKKVDVEDNEEIKKVEGMTLEEINEQKLEELEDEVQENVENISIAMIVVIVLVCAILGTIIGYMLYKLAMNNSNVTAMIFRYFI